MLAWNPCSGSWDASCKTVLSPPPSVFENWSMTNRTRGKSFFPEAVRFVESNCEVIMTQNR